MNRVPLPAGATLGKSFEYGLDINLGTYAAPVWQAVRRISGWAPTYAKTTTDVATYDDLGSTNEDITGRSFAAAFTVQVNRILTTGLYLPEVEALVAAGKAKGDGAVIDVRFYHKPEFGTPNPADAGRAYVTVEVSRQNTGNSETDVLSISLAGKGSVEPIVNPFTGWGTTVPVLSSAAPTAAVAGELVTVTGAGLLGATGVKFGAVSVTEFEVMNGATIIAIMPAGTAGSAPVTVITPAGTSAALAYTRGA
jgi:hypothetical protein